MFLFSYSITFWLFIHDDFYNKNKICTDKIQKNIVIAMLILNMIIKNHFTKNAENNFAHNNHYTREVKL